MGGWRAWNCAKVSLHPARVQLCLPEQFLSRTKHLPRQVKPGDRVAARCQGKSGTSAPTAQIQNPRGWTRRVPCEHFLFTRLQALSGKLTPEPHHLGLG